MVEGNKSELKKVNCVCSFGRAAMLFLRKLNWLEIVSWFIICCLSCCTAYFILTCYSQGVGIAYDRIIPPMREKEAIEVIANISRLEGMVNSMQRLIVVYAGVILALVLFLTWTHKERVETMTIAHVNKAVDGQKRYLETLLIEAKKLKTEIEVYQETLRELDAKGNQSGPGGVTIGVITDY